MNIVNTLVLPEYQSIIKERSNKVFQNEEVPFIDIKIRRPFDGKIIDIETKLSKISYQGKDLLQVVFRDISLQRKVLKMQLRAELAEESNLKLQEEIIKRKKTEKELIKSLEEKDILLKEVHHRVKNNMQIISSILNLQCNRMEKGEAKEILTNSRDRIRSMSLVHENLYRRKDFDKIDLKEYIDSIVSNLMMTYNLNPQEIKITKNIEKTIVSLEKCISLGLIINEIITNAIKHAFTEKLPGEISLRLNTNTDKITSLLIKDNGKGIPDIKKMKKNIGFEIIESLSKQIDAELIIHSENGLSIEMKISNLAYLNEY
jgi:two-component sensor histidine kinase